MKKPGVRSQPKRFFFQLIKGRVQTVPPEGLERQLPRQATTLEEMSKFLTIELATDKLLTDRLNYLQ